MNKSVVILFLILANLFWAGNYVFSGFAINEMSPIQLTFTRWCIAMFLLFPIAHFLEKPIWRKVWREWKVLWIMGVLGIISYNLLLYLALTFTTPLNAALVNSMNPALIVLFSAFLLREKIPMKNTIGVLVSLLGILLILTKGHLLDVFKITYNAGDLIMLAAILVWTIYSIVGKKLKQIPPISATAVSVVFGTISIFPFLFFVDLNFSLSSEAVWAMLYIALFPSVASFIFWNTSLRHINASQAGIYLNLITVFTAILGLLLGQHITIIQIIGGTLVFIGVYLTSKKNKLESVNRTV